MKLTLLSDNKEIDKRYITSSKITDASKLSGCYTCFEKNGFYYLQDPIMNGNVKYFDGFRYNTMYDRIDIDYYGIRPVLEDIDNFDEIIENMDIDDSNGELDTVVKYGLYPTDLPSHKVRDKLNKLKKEGKLNVVGNNSFSEIYEYNGEFYNLIEVKSSAEIEHEDEIEKISTTDYKKIWIKLCPVKWYVDELNKRLIAKDVIMSGVKFHDYFDENIENFINTSMYKYLNEVMLKDLTCSIQEIKYPDMYKLNNEPSNEKDVIRCLILNGIFVKLTGEASQEKYDILKSIDPDYYSCESFCHVPSIADFKNKCISKPDKMHILNLNSLAYYISFTQEDRKRHIKSIVDFMGDVRNYCITSTANSNMNEDSFINIEVKRYIPALIEELYSKRMLHPLICSLILYLGEDRINTLTTPIKLVAASLVLEKTHNISAVRYVIGDELTTIIEQLIKEEIISIKDIVNRKYDECIFEMNNEKKALLIPYLTLVSEEDVEVIRNFIIKLDSSLIYIFDYLWSYNNQDRAKIIEELNMTNNEVSLRKIK